MKFPQDQIDELKSSFPNVKLGVEGNMSYFLITGVDLPTHCNPKIVDVLLCPYETDGYPSRLYYSERIQRAPHPQKQPTNWQDARRILEKNWHVLSWKIPNGMSLRLLQMVLAHLDAFQ